MESDELFRVVVNDVGQYSVWLASLDVPSGWHPVGEPANRTLCLQRVGELWASVIPASEEIER
jgi:MbtH protein